jgi:hypothetical protein
MSLSHQLVHSDARIELEASYAWYDARMPRTTLQLEADAMRVAKAHAQRHRLTLGEAVSDLVRKAAERPLVTEERSGLRVLRLDRRSPKVTADRVDQLREDLP